MERKEAIRSAYRLTGGNNFYDGMITCSTFSGKAVCRLVWDMNKAESDAYLEKALSGIPEHFSGRLLEVPVGTGILTMPLYKTLPKADITCSGLFSGYDGAGAGEDGTSASAKCDLSAGRCRGAALCGQRV